MMDATPDAETVGHFMTPMGPLECFPPQPRQPGNTRGS
jgi:hypothetical protein